MMKLLSALMASLIFCSCGVSAERASQPQQGEARPAAQPTAQPAAQFDAKRQRAAVDPNKFAVIIAGVGGEELYAKRFATQAAQLYDALTNRLGFDEKRVAVLMETVSGGPENGSRENFARATAEEVRKAFAAIKSAANAESLVLVTLIGHGSFDNQYAKFNLVGPDLTAADYATLVGSLPTRRVVFINCASSSGEFVKPLSAENRVVITATRSGNEQNATVFAEHFIAGLSDASADADKNGRISALEAFSYASRLTADWYKQKDRLATEHALIDDNGDGVGHEEAKEGDGNLAKTLFLDSKPLEQAGGDTELARLIAERGRLEESVEKLKARKAEMKPEEYEAELERLLVEIARLSQQIKARQK